MEREIINVFKLTKADVLTALRQFIERQTELDMAGRSIDLNVHMDPIEPPAGVSDLGSPIYDFNGITVKIK